MTCYIVRHGKDDNTVRGGWSDTPLTAEGVLEVEKLAAVLSSDLDLNIKKVYSSDLMRAKQTSEILAKGLGLDVEYLSDFREVNNGILAGVKNDIAKERFPNLFWNTLEWDECYPDGESPKQFFERIKNAWSNFKANVKNIDGNVLLVTHGGVINAIYHIEHSIPYSNKTKSVSVKNAEIVPFEI